MPPERRSEELLRLRELLKASRLRPGEKKQILAQIEALEPKSKSPEPEYRPSPDTPFGLIDRPAPRADTDDDKAKSSSTPESSPAPSLAQSTPLEELKAEEPKPGPQLSAIEINELARQISDIADRIIWLRAYWSTTLSDSVAREESAWHARLLELAGKLKAVAPDALEAAMDGQDYLLSQPVRECRKKSIATQVQERVMPSSAPSSMAAQINSDFYAMLERAHRPVIEQRNPNHLADGLDQFLL